MPSPTRVEPTATDRALTWVLLVGGGALLGTAVLALREWALGLSWLPWRGPIEVLDRIADATGSWASVVLIGAGALVGAVVALASVADEVSVTVADDAVTLAKGDSTRSHRAEDVREVMLDAKHLVLVAHNGTDIARVKVDLDARALAAAFTRHGYHWIPAHPQEAT